MKPAVKVIIGFLSLGISELVNLIRENKKCSYEYIYTPKKNGCCRWRQKCALWQSCLETSKSCKEAHEKTEDPCRQQ